MEPERSIEVVKICDLIAASAQKIGRARRPCRTDLEKCAGTEAGSYQCQETLFVIGLYFWQSS